MRTLRAVAIDLGAGSCRLSLCEWNGGSQPRLVHRFANAPVARGKHLFWDLGLLTQGIDAGLRMCGDQVDGGRVDSVGVSGWAVDYVRVDDDGHALGDPFCYRDPRTETAMAEVLTRISRERLYELTGIQFIRINTLYQLFADQRDRVPAGAGWLNVPEYMLFRLAGARREAAVSEYTNSTHTQLVGVHTRAWCDEVFSAAGLNRAAAPRLVAPGTVVGTLEGALAALPALRGTQLIAPACHDTAAAVAGVPEPAGDWAFISSGTWSLVGALLDEPCTSAAALAGNLTNEGGIGGTYRFLKNVNGLWMLEECLRAWAGEGRHWDVAALVAACAAQPDSTAVFDVDTPELLLPGEMPARINRALEAAGKAPLATDGEHAPAMAAAIFASLAQRYAEVVRALERASQRRFRRIYMLGGGSQNEYLNRLVAQATGMQVIRGPVESATVGNLAVQFATLENGRADAAAVAGWAERLAGAMMPAAAGPR